MAIRQVSVDALAIYAKKISSEGMCAGDSDPLGYCCDDEELVRINLRLNGM